MMNMAFMAGILILLSVIAAVLVTIMFEIKSIAERMNELMPIIKEIRFNLNIVKRMLR